MKYQDFLQRKSQLRTFDGFEPLWMPDFLFNFQKTLVEWSIRKGRSAIFADCGLGKTPMQLVWAENIVRKTNKPVLIVTPLAVSFQVLLEAEKFGIECVRSIDGSIPSSSRVVVTNYERLHLFNSKYVSGLVCDESSILKNFDGVRRAVVTEFSRMLPYRLLCTATAAPNDYVELGTSSEALGELGHMDMLTRFFRNVDNSTMGGTHSFRFKHKDRLEAFRGHGSFWRLKHHAEIPFWKWICSWARAMRRPSDLGFDDGPFLLPPLNEVRHMVKANARRDGWLFDVPAVGLKEEREERGRTIEERCEKVCDLVNHEEKALVWCHLNKEGDLPEQLITDSQQVSGADSDGAKEEKLLAFANGDLRCLITKPKIGAFGLNLQRCNHMTFFPSHSYEQYYQGVRRCWRFGQTKPVQVDIVHTEGDIAVIENLKRKSEAADRMFSSLIEHMNQASGIKRVNEFIQETEIPKWLLKNKPSQNSTQFIAETVAR